MYHQLCDQMHYKALHNKTEGVEKFSPPKKKQTNKKKQNKEQLTEKRTAEEKHERYLIRFKTLVSVKV